VRTYFLDSVCCCPIQRPTETNFLHAAASKNCNFLSILDVAKLKPDRVI